MDVDLLKRHFAHIGARVQVRSDGGHSRRMTAEGLVTLDVVWDRLGELFELRIMPLAEPRIEVIQAVPDQRHLLLLTQANSAAEKNKFLCGHDERHWFVAAVPGRSVATVRSAMEALKPPGGEPAASWTAGLILPIRTPAAGPVRLGCTLRRTFLRGRWSCRSSSDRPSGLL